MRRLLIVFLLAIPNIFVAHAQNQAQQQTIQKVISGVRAPVPLFTPEAEMPDAARREHKTGICLISMIVDAKGLPLNPHIVRCTDPVFEMNSMDAVMKYRFKPAKRVKDGVPVPVMISVEVNFRLGARPLPGQNPPETEPPTQIRYAFFSPPGMNSLSPDANGVYPLSEELQVPVMKEFVSAGFGRAAITFPNGVGCHVLLTLNEKGKPKEAQVLDCDKPTLKEPAIDSLMKSKYKPAKLKGKPVPVRMIVHLIYDGFGPHKQLTASSPSAASQP